MSLMIPPLCPFHDSALPCEQCRVDQEAAGGPELRHVVPPFVQISAVVQPRLLYSREGDAAQVLILFALDEFGRVWCKEGQGKWFLIPAACEPTEQGARG